MKKKERYVVYFTWNDGVEDSFTVANEFELDSNIRGIANRKDCIKRVLYREIYANGKLGEEVKVL